MSIEYRDREGNPLTQDQAYALLADIGGRRVAEDTVGDSWVSTVHLVRDHSLDGRTPLLFETMIFTDGDGGEMWRYSTEAQALDGHARVVAALREGRDPDA